VREYVGVLPSEIVDFKALIGDSSDNYPGVPGIGPKTAQMLLLKFGTVEELYKTLEDRHWTLEGVSAAVVEKLRVGREAGMLSFHLATIRTDAPVELDLEKAKLRDFSKNTVFVEKLKQLGFKSLVTRIGGDVRESVKGKVKREKKKDNGQMDLL
jgi:DNA polymerase-1